MITYQRYNLQKSPYDLLWGYYFQPYSCVEVKNRFSSWLQKIVSPSVSLSFHHLTQVHSDLFYEIKDHKKDHTLIKADALITSLPYCVLMIQTADCLPVVLSTSNTIGLIHAGWKGTQAKISYQTLVKMLKDHQTDTVYYDFLPHIQAHEYVVGSEFENYGFYVETLKPHPEFESKRLFNLALENELQIITATKEQGVQTPPYFLKGSDNHKVYKSTSTFSNSNLPSYRRDGSGYRILNFALLVEKN